MLNKHRKTLLFTGLASAAVITSLALGIWVGRSDLLDSPALSLDSDREQTRDQLIDKLEDAANQQAQTAPSPFDPTLDPFGGSLFTGDPFVRLQQMQQQMDQLFGSFGGGSSLFPGGSGPGAFTTMAQPKIDVEESDDEYRVVISVAKDSEIELKTDLEDNTLDITAQVRSELHDSSGGRQMSSTSMSQFSRSIPLGEPVDATGMRTEKSDSSIVIRIPKIS